MNGQFSGRHVLVTGAGSGIGAATARLFLQEGAYVTGFDLDAEALARQDFGQRFTPVAGDASDPEARGRALACATHDGSLHVLVNNAGVFIEAGLSATDEEWQRSLDVNLLAAAKLTASAAPALAKAKGAVVNVASVSARIAQPDRWTYNASKAALLHLTRCQALDLGRAGVRVNSVSPGRTWGGAALAFVGEDKALYEKAWARYQVLRRCGEPVEIGNAIVFLASDAASFITGADLPVDGGYLVMGPEGYEDASVLAANAAEDAAKGATRV